MVQSNQNNLVQTKTKKRKHNFISPIKSRVIEIWISENFCVFVDEWYLEELIDIIKEYPSDKYKLLMKENIDRNKSNSFPQHNLASHHINVKFSKFNEYASIDEYINETWLNESKISLLKVNSLKRMKVSLSTVGSVVHIPSFLNSTSPSNMLSFYKEKAHKFKSATILINISGHMNWQDYKKIIRQFFKMYDFHNLSIGNISYTRENNIDYYRISVVKVRNGVNINAQGLMFESADFLRRIMFLIYEIDPTHLVWESYGKTTMSKELEKIKIEQPYFSLILDKYFNSQIIFVE